MSVAEITLFAYYLRKSWNNNFSAIAAMQLAHLHKAHANDGYLQMEIANHPHNAQLGNLYLYIHSYNSSAGESPTYIPMHLNSRFANGYAERSGTQLSCRIHVEESQNGFARFGDRSYRVRSSASLAALNSGCNSTACVKHARPPLTSPRLILVLPR